MINHWSEVARGAAHSEARFSSTRENVSLSEISRGMDLAQGSPHCLSQPTLVHPTLEVLQENHKTSRNLRDR